MRLHRLEVAGFGPFAGRTGVDLDELGADGLFLLHGETGAGKTTLLDAVAYALYGRVPGARGEVKRLRSDLAESGTPTEVTLEFSVAGRRIVITRRPEYERPKSRGVGFTKVKAAVSLRYLDGGAIEGLTRAEEVGQVVVDLLGMSAEQFFQVVLLPQGEFARFLRSDTAEREALLERLFATGRFRTIEDFLANARRDANVSAAAARAEVDRQWARLAEAAGLDAAPAEADDAWLRRLESELEAVAMTAAGESETARAAESDARAALRAAEHRDAATTKLLALQAERARLEADGERHEGLLSAIAAAERAAPVIAADRAAEAAARDEAAVMRRHDRTREAVPIEARPELGLAGSHELDVDAALFSLDEDGGAYVPLDDGPVIRTGAAVVRERAGALAALTEESVLQDRELAELTTAQERAATLDRDLARLDLALAELPARIAAAERDLAHARTAVGTIPAREAAAAAACSVHDAARSVTRLDAEVAIAEDAAHTAVERHQRAVDVRQRLVDQRFADMAAELAGGLEDGAGCPVCGSVDHPAPAARTAQPVDAGTLRDAHAVEATLAATRTATHDSLAALRADLAAARALSGGVSQSDADSAWTEAVTVLAGVRAAGSALPFSESTLALAIAQRDDLTRERAEAAAGRQGLAGSIAALDASVAARRGRLSAAAFPFPTVAEHRDHLASLAVALEAWAAAADDLDRARAMRRRADQDLAKAVADAGFATVAEVRAAATLDLAAARAAAQAYEGEVASVASRLADPDLAAADPDGIRIDVSALRAEVARLAADAETTGNRSAAARSRCVRVSAAIGRVAATRVAAAPLIDGAARLSALADTVAGRGQNHKAMSLRSYVLAARLRQVAAVASQRLKRMSEGRYEFVHSQDRESRGRSGGLGIDILDGYTGVIRPAKTLSGGESFLASLALALGLADVVASESGARMLDTIVIDEGFGALDSDTLELVMATLDDLRAGGRVVGIVSHVDDLRQRIPSRLRVRKGVNGSTVEMTT